MVASSAVDRAMTDDEFARIGEMVSNLPVFADRDEEGLGIDGWLDARAGNEAVNPLGRGWRGLSCGSATPISVRLC
jgi:hypothetical protein